MTEPFSKNLHIESRSLIQEDDLLDFREDVEGVLCDAEAALVHFEAGNDHSAALDRLIFLVNRVRSSAEVIGLPWVARLAMMIEDVTRKIRSTGKPETALALSEQFYGGFDAIRRYVDAVIEDRMDVDEELLSRIRELYTAMEAQRERLGQKDLDSLLGELGL